MVRSFPSLLVAVALWLLGAGAVQAQSTAPGAGSWSPGPAAAADAAGSMAGFIDQPANNATLSGPGIQLTGWFVDLTAQGWTGADDVEIVLGTLDSGRPVAHGLLAQNRPDVAGALRNPFWSAAGWTATVPISLVPAGNSTLSVYVHTPNRGWWSRQVTVNVRPGPNQTPPPAPTPTASDPRVGFDISFPQCPSGAEPHAQAFAVVGVTGGTVFSPNVCLAREYFWAVGSTSNTEPRVGFYMNTGNPGPTASTHWPQPGTTTPRPCDGSWSINCAYDYGWSATVDAFGRAVNVAGAPAAEAAPWWLDVEAANSWSTDTQVNLAALDGALASLRSAGVGTVGVYSTSTDWEAVVGTRPPDASTNPWAALPNWRPGARGLADANDWCSRSVTGGRVKLVQFPLNGFDANVACY